MASVLAKIWSRLCPKRKPLSIMIVGLDNSGKTSILDVLMNNSTRAPAAAPVASCRSPSPTNEQDSLMDDGQLDVGEGDFDEPKQRNNNNNNTSGLLIQDSNLMDRQRRPAADAKIIMPTVGYNFERLLYKGTNLTMLDLSGKSKYRGLWQEFYSCVDGILFVVDSSDLIRLVVVRDELENLLSDGYFATLPSSKAGRQERPPSLLSHGQTQKQLTISQGKLVQTPLLVAGPTGAASPGQANVAELRTKVPILFLANKADLPNSVGTEAITRTLNLGQVDQDRHPWRVHLTSVNSSQDILVAFDWLVLQLTQAHDRPSS